MENAALGIGWTRGGRPDGERTEFLDPDGIGLRMVHDATGPRSFVGLRRGPQGEPVLYETPRMPLPPLPVTTEVPASRP